MLIETSVGNFGSFKDMRKCMELDKLETIEVYDVNYWGIHVPYQKEITELQKQIGTYGKTRDTYAAYKRSGWDNEFFEANCADITLHKAAKKYFDEHNFKGKLPSINSLKQEWAALETEHRKLSPGYKTAKENYMSLCSAKANADVILFGEQQPQKSHDRDAR